MDNEWDGQQWVKKIRRTYHFVDWTLALDEMLSDRRPFKFHQPYLKPARNLTEVPQAIYDFYNNGPNIESVVVTREIKRIINNGNNHMTQH